MFYLTLGAALLLALVHVTTSGLRFLHGSPRSVWLSLAGGVSVAYVFVHFLPELAAGQQELAEESTLVGYAGRHVYLVSLVGLLAFYGLDRLAITSRSGRGEGGAPAGRGRGEENERAGMGVFWVHMGSFALYNLLIGYLLTHREEEGTAPLALFTAAMALHFLVADYGLAEDHQGSYRRVGRWILVVALLAGWGLGSATDMPEAAIAALTAFVGGGIVLTVLKEEVPSERQSRFWAFALGAGAYSALLLAV
ncbi:MAG TPA: hypothetical protein VED40_03025 [Azospirillaceae bacterium]|nr:hypothetical protein [Azospirillaceae bacterium]